MLISPGQTIFGVSAKLLQFAAIALGEDFNAHDLSCELGASSAELAPILERLVAEGWVVPTAGPKARYEYEAAMPWRQLRLARTGKPISREKADVLVAAMLERVRSANREPTLDRGLITRVAIFGSYLNTDKTELGDIDLAFIWVFPERAKGLPSFNGRATTACVERNAAKVVKNQSPYLSLTYFEALTYLGCAYADVYRIEDDPEVWSDSYRTAHEYPKLFETIKGT
jgi:hypothetical protein